MGFRDNRFYYINNNKEHLLENLSAWDENNAVNQKERDILLSSIKLQKERERKVYEKLGINNEPIPVRSLYEKIYGTKIENNDKFENILDKSLRILNKFFRDLYTVDNRYLIDEEEKIEEKLTDAENLVKNFYNANKYFDTWLSKSNIILNELEANSLKEIITDIMEHWNAKIANSLLTKNNIRLVVNDNGELIGVQDYNNKEEVLKTIATRHKSFANSIFGSISEISVQYLLPSTSDKISDIVEKIFIYGTSETNDKKSKTIFNNNNNFNNYFNNNDWLSQGDIRSQHIKEYQDILNQKQQKICDSCNIKEPFFTLNVNNENPKADEVVALQLNLSIEPEFCVFGLSNKMGYTKNKRLNIQGTSIGAMLANAFLSDEATVYTKNGSDIIERGGTSIFKEASYVVKAITYSLVNEAGILNWEGKPIQNTTIDNILRRFTTTFAYIWFTGGDIGKSHADFFIVTKNGILKNSKELLDANTYFISMSSILEKALNSLERTEAFFGKVSYSKPIIDKNTMNNIKELKSEKKEKELDFLMFNTSKIIIDKISKVEKNKGSKSIEINNYGILVG